MQSDTTSTTPTPSTVDLPFVLQRLRQHHDEHIDDRLLNVYQLGSRVYGTATAASDWDFMAVVTHLMPLPDGHYLYECYDDGFINVALYDVNYFGAMVRGHRMEAIECICLPRQHVWLHRVPFALALDVDVLRAGLRWISRLRVSMAKRRFVEEPYKARKYLIFGQQLLQHGVITDYAAANDWLPRVLQHPCTTWSDMQAEFKPHLKRLTRALDAASSYALTSTTPFYPSTFHTHAASRVQAHVCSLHLNVQRLVLDRQCDVVRQLCGHVHDGVDGIGDDDDDHHRISKTCLHWPILQSLLRRSQSDGGDGDDDGITVDVTCDTFQALKCLQSRAVHLDALEHQRQQQGDPSNVQLAILLPRNTVGGCGDKCNSVAVAALQAEVSGGLVLSQCDTPVKRDQWVIEAIGHPPLPWKCIPERLCVHADDAVGHAGDASSPSIDQQHTRINCTASTTCDWPLNTLIRAWEWLDGITVITWNRRGQWLICAPEWGPSGNVYIGDDKTRLRLVDLFQRLATAAGVRLPDASVAPPTAFVWRIATQRHRFVANAFPEQLHYWGHRRLTPTTTATATAEATTTPANHGDDSGDDCLTWTWFHEEEGVVLDAHRDWPKPNAIGVGDDCDDEDDGDDADVTTTALEPIALSQVRASLQRGNPFTCAGAVVQHCATGACFVAHSSAWVSAHALHRFCNRVGPMNLTADHVEPLNMAELVRHGEADLLVAHFPRWKALRDRVAAAWRSVLHQRIQPLMNECLMHARVVAARDRGDTAGEARALHEVLQADATGPTWMSSLCHGVRKGYHLSATDALALVPHRDLLRDTMQWIEEALEHDDGEGGEA